MNTRSSSQFSDAAIAFLDRSEPSTHVLDGPRLKAREDIDTRSRMVMQILKIAGFKFIEGTYEFQTHTPHPEYHSTVFTREPDAKEPDERIFKIFFISTDLDIRLPEMSALHIHARADGFALKAVAFDGDQHTLDSAFSPTGESLPLSISDFLRPYMPGGADRIMDLRILYASQAPVPASVPA